MNTQADKQLIKIEVRNVFGKNMIYPVNENARILASIAGTKTLSMGAIERAIALGLNVKEVVPKKINFPVGGVTPGYGGKSW